MNNKNIYQQRMTVEILQEILQHHNQDSEIDIFTHTDGRKNIVVIDEGYYDSDAEDDEEYSKYLHFYKINLDLVDEDYEPTVLIA